MGKKKLKYGRLTFDQRIIIQGGLAAKMSLSKIAAAIGFSVSAVSRELKRNSCPEFPGAERDCPRLRKLIVCNRCQRRSGYCSFNRFFYNCESAEEKSYRASRVTRQTSYLTEDEIKAIDEIVTDGVRLGQSLHHIYVANPELGAICSERTIRRLCYRLMLTAKPHELRKYVVYKHQYRKPKKAPRIMDFSKIVGRSFADYLEYTGYHKRAQVVEFDSVIGQQTDDTAILTITWKETNLQLGLVVKKDSPEGVLKAVRGLLSRFTDDEARMLFGCCLCDNGVEFSRFYDIESRCGKRLLRTFYARPYRSTDKAECERNHEYLRYFFPKGRSLDGITQETVSFAMANINSSVRKSKGDRSPEELMERKYGRDIVERLGVKKIDKRKVVLKLN